MKKSLVEIGFLSMLVALAIFLYVFLTYMASHSASAHTALDQGWGLMMGAPVSYILALNSSMATASFMRILNFASLAMGIFGITILIIGSVLEEY